LFGIEVEVRSVARRRGTAEVSIVHPDGGAVIIPIWATDLASVVEIASGNSPEALFQPLLLIKLVERMDLLRQTVIEERKSCKDAGDARVRKNDFHSPIARSISDVPADACDRKTGDAHDQRKGRRRGGQS